MKKKSYLYLSYFMDEFTPLYGGGIGISVVPDRDILKGDTANTKLISFQNHSGTHVDFPNHFFLNGKTSDKYYAEDWIFFHPFLIVKDILENEIIQLTDEEFDKIPVETDFLIIKTGFGKYRGQEKYWRNNPGLSQNLAQVLRDKMPNLRVIGMDFISITSYQNREIGREAHRNFLGGESPILLVEDMNLNELNTNPENIMCLPLLINGLDGSPVTIVAKI